MLRSPGLSESVRIVSALGHAHDLDKLPEGLRRVHECVRCVLSSADRLGADDPGAGRGLILITSELDIFV